jgi:hypothetical protein
MYSLKKKIDFQTHFTTKGFCQTKSLFDKLNIIKKKENNKINDLHLL